MIALPEMFIRRMQTLLGTQAADFFDSYAAPLRRGVRVNLLKMTAEELTAVFPLPLTPTPFAKDSFYLDAPFKAGADPLFHAGAYYMQEPSAGSVVTVLAPQPGERILDLCAAPGGKSTQIASAMQGQGLLFANEYIRPRARILEQNIERCGVRNAVVTSTDPAVYAARLPGYFDAVLVDAPCSGEGMFRKEPDALADWSEETVARCAARQREILTAAAQAVRPGGRLIYSTCTFAPEENECIAAWFLAAHADFEPLPIHVSFGCPSFDPERVAPFAPEISMARYLPAACRRVLPQHGGAGHFIAAFYRSAGTPGATVPPYRYGKPPEGAEALYADCFTAPLYGIPTAIGETVRLLPPELPVLDGLGVIAAGVQLAERRKDRWQPAHAVFMAADAADCRRTLELAADPARVRAFLHGEELAAEGVPGYTAVTVHGIPCGFGKLSGDRLKNQYPKGLRLRT